MNCLKAISPFLLTISMSACSASDGNVYAELEDGTAINLYEREFLECNYLATNSAIELFTGSSLKKFFYYERGDIDDLVVLDSGKVKHFTATGGASIEWLFLITLEPFFLADPSNFGVFAGNSRDECRKFKRNLYEESLFVSQNAKNLSKQKKYASIDAVTTIDSDDVFDNVLAFSVAKSVKAPVVGYAIITSKRKHYIFLTLEGINDYLWELHNTQKYTNSYNDYLKILFNRAQSASELDTACRVIADNKGPKAGVKCYEEHVLPILDSDPQKREIIEGYQAIREKANNM